MERYLSFTLELSVMIFYVFLDDLLRMENKSFHNSLNFAHISDLVTTKKHSGCLIVSKFDFISLVLPSDDSTNASCSFDKPFSLISICLSKISGKSLLPLQNTSWCILVALKHTSQFSLYGKKAHMVNVELHCLSFL